MPIWIELHCEFFGIMNSIKNGCYGVYSEETWFQKAQFQYIISLGWSHWSNAWDGDIATGINLDVKMSDKAPKTWH